MLVHLNNMWRYDILKNIWTRLFGNDTLVNTTLTYPGGVFDHTMTMYGNDIYVFGGTGPIDGVYGIHLIFFILC